jgi:hypothetical protein
MRRFWAFAQNHRPRHLKIKELRTQFGHFAQIAAGDRPDATQAMMAIASAGLTSAAGR